MTVSKSVPARPSLESLRKQAKKLVRDVEAGDPAAIERARPLSRGVRPAFARRGLLARLGRRPASPRQPDLRLLGSVNG